MDKHNLNALFETVSVKDLTWPLEATKAICDTLKLCNQFNTNQKHYNVSMEEKVTGFVPSFLTWIARLAAEYPILSNLACDLYQ